MVHADTPPPACLELEQPSKVAVKVRLAQDPVVGGPLSVQATTVAEVAVRPCIPPALLVTPPGRHKPMPELVTAGHLGLGRAVAASRSPAVPGALRLSFGRAGPEGTVHDVAEAAPCVRIPTGVLTEDGKDAPSFSVPAPPFLGAYPSGLMAIGASVVGVQTRAPAVKAGAFIVSPHPGRRRAFAAFGPVELDGRPYAMAVAPIRAAAVADCAADDDRVQAHLPAAPFGPTLVVVDDVHLAAVAGARPLLAGLPTPRAVPVRPAPVVQVPLNAKVVRQKRRAAVFGVGVLRSTAKIHA